MAENPNLGSDKYMGLRMDGSQFEIEINGFFIFNTEGLPQQMIFIVRDISKK